MGNCTAGLHHVLQGGGTRQQDLHPPVRPSSVASLHRATAGLALLVLSSPFTLPLSWPSSRLFAGAASGYTVELPLHVGWAGAASEGSVLRCPGEDHSLGQSGVLDVEEVGCAVKACSVYSVQGQDHVGVTSVKVRGRDVDRTRVCSILIYFCWRI